MGEKTYISWCDHTWSPFIGCSKVSIACDGCYAAQLMDTRFHRVDWGGPGKGEGTRTLTADSSWKKPLKWNRDAERAALRETVFPSLCDPFDAAIPQEWRIRFFKLIEQTPNLIWLLLTKRIGNVMKFTDPRRGEMTLPRNAAIGSTFANQEEWDRDSRKLEYVHNTLNPIFTFASLEPLLSDMDFRGGWLPSWIIAGGETDQGDHQARPSHPDWFRHIRDQCAERGVPFHFKQWGSWHPDAVLNTDLAGNCPPPSMKIGAKKSGRLLDGVTHDAFPYELSKEKHS